MIPLRHVSKTKHGSCCSHQLGKIECRGVQKLAGLTLVFAKLVLCVCVCVTSRSKHMTVGIHGMLCLATLWFSTQARPEAQQMQVLRALGLSTVFRLETKTNDSGPAHLRPSQELSDQQLESPLWQPSRSDKQSLARNCSPLPNGCVF